MTKIKRRWLALGLACLLSAGIILAVLGISFLIPKTPTTLSALDQAAQDTGTIRLDCRYSENNHTLSVEQTTTYINHSSRTLYEVAFNIFANAYQKDAFFPAVAKNDQQRAYPNGFDPGYIKMTTPHITVTGEDNTVVMMTLPQPLHPGESVDLALSYNIKLANVKHRLGYTDHTVNLGNFYAIPAVYDNGWEIYAYSANGDPFYNEPYNFDVTMDAPDDYVIASSGYEVGHHHYQGKMLRDFAMVLSRKFQVISKQVGDTTVKYYYLADEIPEVSLYTACNALAYFSNEFIDYPYATLSVVQTDFLHGGMEYGALVYIALDVTDQLQYQNVIVHEIAHQWWYGLVGNNQNATAWIDEGLAEYSTAVFFETHPQYGKTLTGVATENQNTIKMFETIMTEYNVPYSRDMNTHALSYKLSSEYTINTYARGMLLFYNITDMVGYQNLNHALAQFARDNQFKFGTARTLTKTLEEQLGYDLQNYCDNYLAGNQ